MVCQKICLGAVLIFFSHHTIFSTGFVAGTLVRTEAGYLPIEQLKEGDQVIGFNSNKVIDCCNALSVVKGQSDKLVKITVDDEFFIVAPDQLFLTPQNTWIQALNLKSGYAIVGLRGSFEIDNVEVIEGRAEVYTLSIEDKGVFFVSMHCFVVFNFPNAILWRTGGRIVKTAIHTAVSTIFSLVFH